ncbi:MAG TPA: hypothetical protein VH475_24345, partial [Tepidisphaeraceae bacterium]
ADGRNADDQADGGAPLIEDTLKRELRTDQPRQRRGGGEGGERLRWAEARVIVATRVMARTGAVR